MTGDVVGGPARPAPVLPPWSLGRVLVAVLGLALLVPLGLFYLASGLVVPLPWLIVLWAVFLALVAAAVVLVRRHSWWVPAVPVVGAALCWVTITLGERFGGWTA